VGLVGFPLYLGVDYLRTLFMNMFVWLQVLRPWKAASRCGACFYPNDVDANFCQACGSRTSLSLPTPGRYNFDEAAILVRFQEFDSCSRSKPYYRQKCALEKQLCDFLASVSPPKSISSCCADDIVKFLIHKDRCGKTVVHSASCSRQDGCGCATRLAAGTVDSLIGKLRAISIIWAICMTRTL
jgi:hypothetical protein